MRDVRRIYSLTNEQLWLKKEEEKYYWPLTGKASVCLYMHRILCVRPYIHILFIYAHIYMLFFICSQELWKASTIIIFSKIKNVTLVGCLPNISWWSWLWTQLAWLLVQCSLHYTMFLPKSCLFSQLFFETAFPTLLRKQRQSNCSADLFPLHTLEDTANFVPCVWLQTE